MVSFLKNPSALSQVLIVAFVCFTCPGMFNALTSITAGIADEDIDYNGTAILYGFFAVFGLFAGGIVNVVGPKFTLFIGTFGYIMYAVSLLVMDHHLDAATEKYTDGARDFFYAANAILGLCAGMLWTAQGQMCMAYPTTETKGKYFSYFWIIFNLGACLGGFLTFGTNYDNHGKAATTSTYVVFLVLMCCGTLLSLVLVDPNTVVRNDGSMVTVEKHPNPLSEIVEVFKLFFDPKMLLLFPLFAYSNWFYQYQFGWNGAFFNARTKGFNSAFYWGAQMVGAFLIGKFLDRVGNKRTKAFQSMAMILFVTMFMWGAALWVQISFDVGGGAKKRNIDFKGEFQKDGEGNWFPKFLLYILFGFNDAIVQVWSYWLMGQFSDDMVTLGRYAGYYKGVQSGMAAVAWKIGAIKSVLWTSSVAINWGLGTLGIIGAFVSSYLYLEDTPAQGYEGVETPVEGKSSGMAIH
ncbi:Aste57867_2196 [Aphanomyces stellatus]|uniref:Aste57867_2196 protein n=1 Tax=Aphanomyces stellatus TaxID=120398 RepID=A0A485K832_9STRA|nr:hypothetical protein As57867_002191 [Aphanomyces stellatus]VFT79399.1 Aste57867_2196 [Aphanomyces stellatus]